MLSFSLGIPMMWDEFAILQSPGFYWINSDRKIDADILCRHVIKSLPKEGRAALICGGEAPEKIVNTLIDIPLNKLPMFTLPEKESAMMHLTTDLTRSLAIKNRLLLLHIDVSFWHLCPPEEIADWIQKTNAWVNKEQCTLLVLTYGSGVSQLNAQLMTMRRYLDGFSNLQWQESGMQYAVSWWGSENGIMANQHFLLKSDVMGNLALSDTMKAEKPISLNDNAICLAEKNIFEGADPPSLSWTLFENNKLVAESAMHAQAATVIFALYNSAQVEELSKQVHQLRIQAGNALKIVIREMSQNIRHDDEILLQVCGASLIIPVAITPSQFIMMIEGIQGQILTRYIPENFDVVAAAVRSISVKGYLSLPEFSEAVLSRINNTMLPLNSKGVLVNLTPIERLSTKQALTLCALLRVGDIISADDHQLFLFLSTCSINNLDTALKFVFRLPLDQAFLGYSAWHEDSQIISEIKSLGSKRTKTKVITSSSAPTTEPEVELPTSQEPPKIRVRRTPVPLTLNMSHRPGEI